MLPQEIRAAWKVRVEECSEWHCFSFGEAHITQSLTIEWADVVKVLWELIQRNVQSSHSKQSERKYEFGKESVLTASQNQSHL